MSYPPCRYAHRWPELWAQQRSDNDRRILSNNLASGRLDGQEPSRAFVAAFIDRILGRITRGQNSSPATTTSHPAPAPTTNPPPLRPTRRHHPLPHHCCNRPPPASRQAVKRTDLTTGGASPDAAAPPLRAGLPPITLGCAWARHAGRGSNK